MTTLRPANARNLVVQLLAGTAFVAMFAAQAAAEDTELTQQKFQISLGSFTNESEIVIRADGEFGEGTTFDWGDTIGDVDGTTFRLDSYWRINDRHHVRFMYTENSNKRNRTLDRSINWDGETYLINTEVDSEFGFYVVEVAYEYDFSKREDRELVLSAGLHYTAFSAELSGTVTTPGGGGTASASREASVGAPLPVIGARGMWNLGGNWWLDGQVQFFQVTFGDVDGSIINYRAAVIWQPKKWLGFGAGYDSFGIDVDVEGSGDRLRGSLDWTYQGPQVFFNFAF
ncbi:MAG TPA: hypothetical protein VFU13_06585 [Steroidobacteraceae bacterium]|nr:hypothetical protein [Steroidobacteraceae bacterium]